MRVRNVPVWALLFCIPVSLLAINCGSVDLGADSNTVNNDDLKQVVTTDVAAKDVEVKADAMNTANNDLNLEDGATDEWRWGRGWGGRGWGGGWGRWGRGWGGGWGGWGSGWGWGSYWPYYSWYYPYAYTGWYW